MLVSQIDKLVNESEVRKTVKPLKKAAGFDRVRNAEKWHPLTFLVTALVKLSFLSLVFLNQGCKSDPYNCKGICCMSSLEKLNARLSNYVQEKNTPLSHPSHFGFLREYRTTDHIFR